MRLPCAARWNSQCSWAVHLRLPLLLLLQSLLSGGRVSVVGQGSAHFRRPVKLAHGVQGPGAAKGLFVSEHLSGRERRRHGETVQGEAG